MHVLQTHSTFHAADNQDEIVVEAGAARTIAMRKVEQAASVTEGRQKLGR